MQFGFVGKKLNLFGIQQQLSIIIRLQTIFVVSIPQKTFNKYNFSRPLYRIIGKVKSALGKELKKKSPDTFLTIGFLNGFLPCGLVYMAIFWSDCLWKRLAEKFIYGIFWLGNRSAYDLGNIFGKFFECASKTTNPARHSSICGPYWLSVYRAGLGLGNSLYFT